ncbi:peptidoglycan-binding domain-containing protein [Streptomyces sp. NPDC006172]|uniref:peptidoglycan-binding domain-containing protein n=1 Tax=Streptomyces sp. NPDC006172 TaxID=3154470 RepID=UPI0033DE2F63
MRTDTRRARFTVGAVGALTAAVLGLSASPAAASGTYSGRAYVYGGGAFAGDWSDEGIVSTGTNRQSNATCLWQKILWADGKLAASGIDGDFGTGTYNATREWQSTWNLQVDGSAGRNTWTEAGKWLRDIDGNGAVDTYIGLVRNFTLSRDSDGRYHFPDGNGSGRIAGYDYRTCS